MSTKHASSLCAAAEERDERLYRKGGDTVKKVFIMMVLMIGLTLYVKANVDVMGFIELKLNEFLNFDSVFEELMDI